VVKMDKWVLLGWFWNTPFARFGPGCEAHASH
jgi:hypothetical protein